MVDVRRALLSVGVLVVSCASAWAQPQIAINGTASPNGVSVPAGTAVSVAVSGGPGNTTDWIALYPTGASDGAYLDWKYLSGSTAPPSSGLTDATIQELLPVVPGDYEIRWFASNSYERLATSGTITVTPSTTAITVNGVAQPNTATVAPGTTLSIGVTHAPGNATDWFALAAAGAADTSYLDFRYLNGSTTPPASGLTSATLSLLAPITEGDYEIRFFVNNSSQRLTQTPFIVHVSSAALAVNGVAAPTTVTAAVGTTAVVGLNDGPGNATDWVGMFAVGATNAQYLAWQYLNGSTSAPATGVTTATLHFLLPATPGNYEFRLFSNNTTQVVTTSSTVTLTASTAQIAINGTAPPDAVSAVAGSVITASVSNGPGNATDWLALYAVGAPDGSYIDFRYLNGATQPPATGSPSGEALFTLPATAGNFEVRLFAANSYERIATSSAIAVSVTRPTKAWRLGSRRQRFTPTEQFSLWTTPRRRMATMTSVRGSLALIRRPGPPSSGRR